MPKKPIIIGVTGGSGGGKTSVSRAILSNFPDEKIAMIEHDSYYKDQSHLTFEERVSTNYDHPFAFDTDLMIEHINELIAGRCSAPRPLAERQESDSRSRGAYSCRI